MANDKSIKELMAMMGKTPTTNAGKANAMLELIEGRKPFAYDPNTDPMAQTARQETARNIGRTTQDTLGSYAAMTGGMPSSAAVSAAAQAGNLVGAQGVDRIAELEQLARANYDQETTDMQNMWSIYQGLADAEKASAGSGGTGYRKIQNQNPVIDDNAARMQDIFDGTMLQYGMDLPQAVYDQLVAQWGKDQVEAAGFRRKTTQNPTAGTGGGTRTPAQRHPGIIKGEETLHTRD